MILDSMNIALNRFLLLGHIYRRRSREKVTSN